MLFKEYKSFFMKVLSPWYDVMEIESFFYIILEFFHDKKRIDLALNPSMELSNDDLVRWNSAVDELKKEKPIQYILGETQFYGLKFQVNQHTLIPRPETEELVEWIIEASKKIKDKSLKILDVGTGSGCIAISLAKNLPNAQVFALDVSENALLMAEKNAKINEVNVNFILADVLNVTTLDIENLTNFDIIVSNPPYVRNLEKEEIKPNVLEFEPHLALFVEDNDALLFYRKIGALALKNLNLDGTLYFEINQYLGKETMSMLTEIGFSSTELKQDVYQNDRMICCKV